MAQTTNTNRVIKATAEKIYEALTDPRAIEVWRVPGNMTGKVHRFHLAQGGGYEMSLFYPATGEDVKGKTADKEDRFTSTFVELIPFKKITESIRFYTTDPYLAGEMTMETILEPMGNNTKVTFVFKNIPPGIKASDNEAGTIAALEKLAVYIE